MTIKQYATSLAPLTQNIRFELVTLIENCWSSAKPGNFFVYSFIIDLFISVINFKLGKGWPGDATFNCMIIFDIHNILL